MVPYIFRVSEAIDNGAIIIRAPCDIVMNPAHCNTPACFMISSVLIPDEPYFAAASGTSAK